MAALEGLSEEEACLVSILTDPSGSELAEFMFRDDEAPGGRYRLWDFQWIYNHCDEKYQVDSLGRGLGKSQSSVIRACAFPFNYPGREMLITAPQLNHLSLVTDKVEENLLRYRLLREMLPGGARNARNNGIKKQPQFQATFVNGAKMISRLPGIDGKGVKGPHPIAIELDELQDFPRRGFTELTETIKASERGAIWRAHGVSNGVGDIHYELTHGKNPDLPFYVHRYIASHRPTWNDEERRAKIALYGGSEDAPDYVRNIFGEPGSIHNPVFVLARLMACVRINESAWASQYNDEVYSFFKVNDELRRQAVGDEGSIRDLIQLPMSHLSEEYASYWAGMDVGYTTDPSEILVFGVVSRRGKPDLLRLLTRISLVRISAEHQVDTILHVFEHYGTRLRRFGMDKMQPVSEPVLTPDGWKPIGQIRVGDQVVGSDGRGTRVTGVFPQQDRRVMRVTFNDGSWTRCGPEHLWTVETPYGATVTVTTEQLEALRGAAPSRANQWAVPLLSGPAQHTEVDLPLDPYVLGVLLGDGNLRAHSVRLSSVDREILDEVQSRLPDGYRLRKASGSGCDYELTNGIRTRDAKGQFTQGNAVLRQVRALGLAGSHSWDKFVPDVYLRSSTQQRIDLLRGIMDTDGWVTPTRTRSGGASYSVGFRSSSERLAWGVVELVQSLGGTARYATHATSCNGKPGRMAHRLSINLPSGINPFRLTRKARVVTERPAARRFVRSIEPDGEEQSVCIRVAAEDHLYVTRGHILTHNTGNGLPLFQLLKTHKNIAPRLAGYGFSEKKPVEFDNRELREGEKQEDLVIVRSVVDFATDELRKMVDNANLELPYDIELLGQWQGQGIQTVRSTKSGEAAVRRYVGGADHTLDAARMFAAAKQLDSIEKLLEKPVDTQPVLARFF